MSDEEGKRFRAWGPNRTGRNDPPDVDGTIIGGDGERIVVQESQYDTPTSVKLNGGWYAILVTAACVALVLWLYLPASPDA